MYWDISSSVSLFLNNYNLDTSYILLGSAILAYFITALAKASKNEWRFEKNTYNKLAIRGFIFSLFLFTIGLFLELFLGVWVYLLVPIIAILIPLIALKQIKNTGASGKYFACMSLVIILLTAGDSCVQVLEDVFRNQATVVRETAMTEGMVITASTTSGNIVIQAGKGFERTYTWDNCTRSVTMYPREKRWFGGYGIYYPGEGNHWNNCNGITRGVLEEGQQHFDTIAQAIDFIKKFKIPEQIKNIGITRESTIYSNDGLLVSWSFIPRRNSFNAEVWQILINNMKPTQLPGAQDGAITVTQNSTE